MVLVHWRMWGTFFSTVMQELEGLRENLKLELERLAKVDAGMQS